MSITVQQKWRFWPPISAHTICVQWLHCSATQATQNCSRHLVLIWLVHCFGHQSIMFILKATNKDDEWDGTDICTCEKKSAQWAMNPQQRKSPREFKIKIHPPNQKNHPPIPNHQKIHSQVFRHSVGSLTHCFVRKLIAHYFSILYILIALHRFLHWGATR